MNREVNENKEIKNLILKNDEKIKEATINACGNVNVCPKN